MFPIRENLLRCLVWLESRCMPAPRNPGAPPVFLIGPPRSGTTLACQAICHGLNVSCPSNLVMHLDLYRAPRIGRRVLGHLRSRHPEMPFDSHYGASPGPTGPSEAGKFWNAWIPPEKRQIGETARREIRRFVAAIETMGDGPFVNKNVMHSMRIPVLDQLFPEALFIEMHRDTLMTAQSIYLARIRQGSENRWWSVRPGNADALLQQPLTLQAVAQVMEIRHQIDIDLAKRNPARRLALDYDQLCENPAEVIMKVMSFMNTGGARTTVRRPLPTRFERSTRITVDPGVLHDLQHHIARYRPASTPEAAQENGP